MFQSTTTLSRRPYSRQLPLINQSINLDFCIGLSIPLVKTIVTFVMSAILICKWTLSHCDDDDDDDQCY